MDEVVVLSIPQIIITFVAAMGIPSALTSYMLSRHEKRLEKRDEQREKERAKKEKDMDTHQKLLLETINASLALGEATARAVQRIPDAHCNGDMHAALDYAAKVKHEQKDFLTTQGIESIYES